MKLNLDISHFLKHYWQKKPLYIKNGLPAFEDPITPEEMAGLAMEEEVQSRFVYRDGEQWQAECGPFDDFSRLSENGATLLNQAVNHWHEASAELVNHFRFIPDWRFDDLMISLSSPEGGVGPHIDQYCVFIIQGQGKRHWRVGEKQSLKEFGTALRHCEAFEACIDVVMEPGDILYIPPGCPHEGYAVEQALNYSVGFRAPDQKELLDDMADYLLQTQGEYERYTDPERLPATSIAKVSTEETNALQEMLVRLMRNDDIMLPFLGQRLSTSNHEFDLCPLPPEEFFSIEELNETLTTGATLQKVAGVKFLWLEGLNDCFFVAGDRWQVSQQDLSLFKSLCEPGFSQKEAMKILRSDSANVLISLINEGYLYVE